MYSNIELLRFISSKFKNNVIKCINLRVCVNYIDMPDGAVKIVLLLTA